MNDVVYVTRELSFGQRDVLVNIQIGLDWHQLKAIQLLTIVIFITIFRFNFCTDAGGKSIYYITSNLMVFKREGSI